METAGVIEGTTLELVRPIAGGELSALLAGARQDRRVSFTKVYDAAVQLDLAPIAYAGAADAELLVVRGDWVPVSRESHPLHGSFIMRRISSSRVFTLSAAREMSAEYGTRMTKQASVTRPRHPRPKLSLKGE